MCNELLPSDKSARAVVSFFVVFRLLTPVFRTLKASFKTPLRALKFLKLKHTYINLIVNLKK